MKRLLLARHGQSVSNAARRFQGQRDVPLSPLGERQAEALGRALRRRVREVAAVYTSPLARARRTAEIAAAGLGRPLVAVADLREVSLGEWEDLTVDEVRARSGDPFARWVRDPLACPPPGGEPLLAVQERVVGAIAAIAAAHADGEEVLVVCHGGVISAYLAHCLGLPLSGIWRLALANGSLTELAPPRVLSMNDTSHLAALGSLAAGGFSP
jgi:broad specificity phosphatase PhoE